MCPLLHWFRNSCQIYVLLATLGPLASSQQFVLTILIIAISFQSQISYYDPYKIETANIKL